MNVLLLYPFYNQKNLIHNFSKRLGEKGIKIDSICTDNMKYEKNTEVVWPSVFQFFISILGKEKSSVMWARFQRLFYYCVLPSLFSKYDAVDFHSYYPQYNKLMSVCVKNKVKFFVTLWGSDLMRADEKRLQVLRYGFDHCFKIKLTDNLYEILSSQYSGEYNHKCRIVYFGNSDFDDIDKLKEDEFTTICQSLFGDTEGKKIVTCGYNATPAQNHETIIRQLATIDRSILDSCHFVFPLTYGGDEDYKNRVKQLLEDSNLNYTVLSKFMTSVEIATLRKATDIVVNIQDTDALAGSLQDHLYCGGICIIGEWLRYIPYDKNNIFYIKTGKDNIADNLVDVLMHFDSYYEKCIPNHEKIRRILSWESTIETQRKVYGE